MAFPASLQSLYSSVYTNHDGPVIAGIAVTAIGGFVSVFVGSELLLLATPTIGGLTAGFLFGKYWKQTAKIGFRVGVIGATLVIGVSLLLLAGGFWTVTVGPPDVGVVGIYEGEPGFDGYYGPGDAQEGFTGGDYRTEEGGEEEVSPKTAMTFLLIFSVGAVIPASALLAMLGCAVGTNVRRAVVPDEHNPPLF